MKTNFIKWILCAFYYSVGLVPPFLKALQNSMEDHNKVGNEILRNV